MRFVDPWRRIGLAAAMLLPWSLCGAQSERSVGIVPQQSPIALARQWQPLLDDLSRRTGIRLRFATATTIDEFEERALEGAYDYIYASPLFFRQLNRQTGYRALGHDTEPIRGIIVVRNDGPRTLTGLANQTIAFPAARAIGATLLTRADLRRLGIPHHAVYLGTHESAYQAVIQGQYPAAGGIERTLDQLAAPLRGRLRILHTTRPVMSHIFAAHPRVPREEARRLQRALLALHREPDSAPLLTALGLHRFVPVTSADLATLSGIRYPRRPSLVRFHVIPRLDEAATRRQMLPLAAYLRQRLDINFELHTYSDMGRFQDAIYRESHPALVSANPIQAIALAHKGYEAVAQQLPVGSEEGMRTLIVVKTESPCRTLADLAGKRIAFARGRDAFFANVVPKTMLRRAGLEGRYVDASRPGPLSAMFPRLRDGEIDAFATGSLAWSDAALQEQYIRGRMRILASSEPLPGLAWLVGPRLDRDLRDEIQDLLVNFRADAPGRAAMHAAGVGRMKAADNRTYATVARYLTDRGP